MIGSVWGPHTWGPNTWGPNTWGEAQAAADLPTSVHVASFSSAKPSADGVASCAASRSGFVARTPSVSGLESD